MKRGVRAAPPPQVYWPLSLLLFRLQPRLQQQVEAFQRRQRWGTHTVIGVQVRGWTHRTHCRTLDALLPCPD